MSNPPVIEAGADGRVIRTRPSPLAGRRIMAAAIIALAQVAAIIAWRPSLLMVVLVSSVVTVVAAWGSFKLVRHSFLRDVLWVIALSQAMVVAIPLVLGVSFIAALIVAVVLLIGLVLLVVRSRS